MKNLLQFQQCLERNLSLSTLGKLRAAVPGAVFLIALLTMTPGCGKKKEPSVATPPSQEVPSQAATPAPVQRPQYEPRPAATPAPTPSPAATVRQINPVYPAGTPMTKPAGASKPVPIVP